MTEQEKKLMELIACYDVSINRNFESLSNGEFCEALAKAIFKAFPQITKKPVKIDVSKLTGEAHLVCDYEIANNIDKFESEYDVEVIND